MPKYLTWIVIVVVILALGIGTYLVSRDYFKELFDKKTSTDTSGTTPTPTSALNQKNSPTATSSNNLSGWKTFTNKAYSYSIQYPSDATVKNSAVDADKDKASEQSGCLKISTDYYFILIAKPMDEADPAFCLRTGFGTEWGNAPDDSITIEGQTYKASGMKTESASAGYYQDDFMVAALADGNRIEFGTSVNEKYDDKMTKAQAKELVKKILATYKSTK